MSFFFFFLIVIQVTRRQGRVSKRSEIFRTFIYLKEQFSTLNSGNLEEEEDPSGLSLILESRVNSGVSGDLVLFLGQTQRVLVTDLYGCFRPAYRRSSPRDNVRGLPGLLDQR